MGKETESDDKGARADAIKFLRQVVNDSQRYEADVMVRAAELILLHTAEPWTPTGAQDPTADTCRAR